LGPASQRRRVLLVAPHSSYRISPYLNAAQELGVEVLVASTSEHSLVSAVAQGLRIDLQDPNTSLQAIQAAHTQQPFTGVVATDDASVSLAAFVAQALGLPHNPPEAVKLTQRKDLARARLAQYDVPVPRHWRMDLEAELTAQAKRLDYPVVLKPLNLSGSRGVIRADTAEECLSACRRIENILREQEASEAKRYLLAERYIPGVEVALEGMLHDGQLQVLALFDKPDPMEGPFFEETYYITPSRLSNETQDLIAKRVSEACRAYGLVHGPIHAELRLHDGEAWILEVAARTIGGQCARLLQSGTGHSLEALVMAQAMGEPLEPQGQDMAAGVLMIPIPKAGMLRRVEGLGAARRVEHILDVEIWVREGYELVPLPEGSAYLGFIFAQGPGPEEVEQALRDSHACLNFVTAPAWRIM
jgi:biotin carboxylase